MKTFKVLLRRGKDYEIKAESFIIGETFVHFDIKKEGKYECIALFSKYDVESLILKNE